MTPDAMFHELCYYTMAHGDPVFIHQHAVDAFAAQQANETSNSIQIAFALVGLYLLVEKSFTGKQVQRVHMKLAQNKQVWPIFSRPENRGSIHVGDVLQASPGLKRDQAIHTWCSSVWEAFSNQKQVIEDLLHKHGIE